MQLTYHVLICDYCMVRYFPILLKNLMYITSNAQLTSCLTKLTGCLMVEVNMTENELISILHKFKGGLKDVMDALSSYPELGRVEIGAIRKVLGYSAESNHKLTKEQHQEMVDEYNSGETSLRKLAQKYGVTLNSVRCLLKRRKVDTSPKDRWSKIKKHRLIDLRANKKLSYTQIAKMMSLSTNAIVQQAHRLGFPPEKSGLDPYKQTFNPFAKDHDDD